MKGAQACEMLPKWFFLRGLECFWLRFSFPLNPWHPLGKNHTDAQYKNWGRTVEMYVHRRSLVLTPHVDPAIANKMDNLSIVFASKWAKWNFQLRRESRYIQRYFAEQLTGRKLPSSFIGTSGPTNLYGRKWMSWYFAISNTDAWVAAHVLVRRWIL